MGSTGRPPPADPHGETMDVSGEGAAHALTTPAAGAAGAEGTGWAPVFTAGDLVAERYQVARFLAAGGMGEVYEVHDRMLGERVALKAMRGALSGSVSAGERFRREIQLARRVTHANVCRIFDVGVHEGAGGAVAFLTMEFLAGETLADRLRRGPMTTGEVVPLLAQMAAALDAAHEAGVIHRDLKSQNVMLLARAGGAPRVVVTDFGLARAAGHEPGGDAGSGAATLLGTPAYMAPEQVEGTSVSPRTDVYALGIVLFEMITGRLPFVGKTPLQTAVLRLKQPPPAPATIVPGVDARWDAAILRCLAVDPAARFASAGEVVAALVPPASPAVAEASLPGGAGRRSRVTWLAAGVALAVAAAGTVWWATRPASRTPAPPPAPRPVLAPSGEDSMTRALARLIALPSKPGNACASYFRLSALGDDPLPVPDPGVGFTGRLEELAPGARATLARLAADPDERRHLEAFREGAKYTTCQILDAVFPRTGGPNPLEVEIANYKPVAHHAGVARFLALELEREGRRDEAVAWLEALVVAGWHLQQDEFLLGNLIGTAMAANAADSLAEVTARAGEDERSARWRAFAGVSRQRRFESWTDGLRDLLDPKVLATDEGVERIAAGVDTPSILRGARAEALIWVAMAHLVRPGAPAPSAAQRAHVERWTRLDDPVLAAAARRVQPLLDLPAEKRAELAAQIHAALAAAPK